uniref:MAK10-like protein n=1 Tax=Tanacetum cinerariifolium TaxID=118510 RepID=A0A6L2JT99_TANCI|nr:MAK10-like protein [Tanacetum cinerariifolium]
MIKPSQPIPLENDNNSRVLPILLLQRLGNNVVPLRSDTIWLVQNGCSFHGLRSEAPNQHLKDFLKLVDSLNLDGYLDSATVEAIQKWKLEKAFDDFDSYQEKRLSSLRTQLGQQQEDMIEKINLLRKTVSKKLNDRPIPEHAGNSMDSENIASISHVEREELRRKGIKSLSKLFFPKHHARILTKYNERSEGRTKKVIDEEESDVETDKEVEEILKDEEEEEDDEDGENFNSFPTMEELTHHEWLLNNPRPLWVKARIRSGSLYNIKISCMIGHFFKRHALRT